MIIKTIGNKIKNVILDLGVVLIDLTPQYCIQTFHNYGVKDIEHVLNSQHYYKIFRGFETGIISASEFRDQLRTLSGIPLTDTQINTAWNHFLGDIPEYKLEFLEELGNHFNLYLLSNTNPIHWEWIKEKYSSSNPHSLEGYFKKLYLSYELNSMKPDRAIFEYVIEDSGILPEETFFIDDAPENCHTAGSLGIQSYTPLPREDWRHLFQ